MDNAAPMSTTANDEPEPDSKNSRNNDHEHEHRRQHEPDALCTHDNTNTKALAHIGEGGGWFSGVSEVTTTVVAVPIPFHSHGNKLSYFISVDR